MTLDEPMEDINASAPPPKVDHAFFVSRRDQCESLAYLALRTAAERASSDKQVFPSLDFIGWYTVALGPTPAHVAIHEQLVSYTTTPILVILHPAQSESHKESGMLPFRAYEPTVAIR